MDDKDQGEQVDAPKQIEDVVADPVVEAAVAGDAGAGDDAQGDAQAAAVAAGDGEVQPSDGPAAQAVDDAVPNPDAGGKAVDDEEDPIAPPTQREDGKWTDGKYVGDTIEDLFVQVKKAQRAAEKRVGKKKEELLEEDPFLLGDTDFNEDEFDLVDDHDFGQQVGAGVVSALQQAGLATQMQLDPYMQHAQAVQIAQQAIDSPHTTDQEFRAVLAGLIQANPNDHESRQAVLNEWAERRPAVAAQEAVDIRMAFAQHQQALEQQARAEFEQAQQAMKEQELGTQQQEAAEFRHGQEVFVAQHPDWAQRNDAMNQWLQENQWLMDNAKRTPLVDDAGRRARAEAVSRVLKMAYDASAPAPAVAGVEGGASEQGSNMGVVTEQAHIDPAAAARSLAAESRGLAALETGAAVDDVSISVANPNPPGLESHSFTDLTGIPTVPA